MKKVLAFTALILVLSGTVFGGTSGMQLKIGSNILTVDNKQIKLSQPVTSNNSGVMVPIDVLSKGFGASVSKKDDTITITPKEVPEVEFITDDDKGLLKLETLFDQSRYNIYISMFSLTNDRVVKKIINSKYPDRKVFIFLDYNENHDTKEYRQLRGKKNVFIKFRKRYLKNGKLDKSYIYHKKIGIFDGKVIFTGSSNWTEYGFYKNDEQNFIINSSAIASQAKSDFLKEWETIK